jgi:hypothetical protein
MKTRNNALKEKKSKSCLPKKLCHEKKRHQFSSFTKRLVIICDFPPI